MARFGIDRRQLFAGEVPRRQVMLAPFELSRTEVTRSQFARFLEAVPRWGPTEVSATTHNGRYLEDWRGAGDERDDTRPVTFITWAAASAYCAWSGGRLPTEAEWEYAAAGGLARPTFPWGDEMPTTRHANWAESAIDRPTAVAEYPANGFGLHDMAGNVWEFTSDRWSPNSGEDPALPLTRFVIRGGSYGGAAVNLRVRYRDSHPAGGAGPHVGFRCAYP